LGASQFFFLFNFVWSLIAGKKSGIATLAGHMLEWSAPTPPPHGNFEDNRLSTAAPTSTARRKSKRIGCRKIEISVLPPQRERN